MNHADRGHSVLGASAAYRWMNCPGSVKMLMENPQPTSPAAADGTLTHELAEKVLLYQLGSLPLYPEYDCKERLARAEFYADIVYDKYQDLNLYGDAEYAIEKSFELPYDSRFFGTNDAAVWNDEELHVFDLKDGFAPVKAENNPQLMYYALGLLSTLDYEPKDIYVHIVMPRHNSHDSWHVPKDRLAEFINELKDGAKKVDAVPDLCVPGEWCKFCAKTACPAFAEDMKEKALVAFDEDGDIPDVTVLPFDKLKTMLDYETRVMQMFKDARMILHERALEGKEVEGYKLVRKQGNRVWADPEEVATKARRWGLKKSQLFDTKLKSPSQITRLGVPQAEVDKYTQRPDKGTALVHVDQPGEPLQIGEGSFEDNADLQ